MKYFLSWWHWLALVFTWASSLNAQTNTLQVGDPRVWGSLQGGTLESVNLTITPHDAFATCALELVYSARGSRWQNTKDSLEVVHFFTFPERTVFFDSWLWIDNNIIRAQILERNLARTTFEGFVRRRTDPSILYKNTPTQYEFRIFPLVGNQTRRVQLFYLVPLLWQEGRQVLTLPNNLWSPSANVPNMQITVRKDALGRTPRLLGSPSSLVAQGGGGWRVALPNTLGRATALALELSYAGTPPSVVVSTLESGKEEGFYQVTWFPQLVNTPRQPIKQLFLVEHVEDGILQPQQMLTHIKEALRQHLAVGDSFNVFFANLSVRKLSERWLAYNPATFDAQFPTDPNVLFSYANLTGLLAEGIDFVRQRGSDAYITLYSNSGNLTYVPNALQIADSLTARMGKVPIPFFIADAYTGGNRQSINGVFYVGNQLFYQRLLSRTKGAWYSLQEEGDIQRLFSKATVQQQTLYEQLEMDTDLDGGIAYGNFAAHNEEGMPDLRQPLVQVGRYRGKFPLVLEAAALYNGQVYKQRVQVPTANMMQADTVLREWWYGTYFRTLERVLGTQSSAQLLPLSLQERVLTRATAFFCPDDQRLICTTCNNGTGGEVLVVGTQAVATDSLWTVAPNPFRDHVTFRFRHPAWTGQSARIDILTVQGTLVSVLRTSISGQETQLTWDGTNGTKAMPAGVYWALLRVGGKQYTVKLIKQE